MEREYLNVIQGVDFELTENLLNNRTDYLLIIGELCEKVSNSKQFVIFDIAGRHRGLNAKYKKHNLFP